MRRLFVTMVTVAMALMLNALAYSPQASFQLEEELPAGTQVGNIREALRQSLLPEELANISVRLYLPEDPVARLFQVLPNGSVFTSQQIDRDCLCQRRNLCCDRDMRQAGATGGPPPHCLLKFDVSVTTVVNRRFLMPTVDIQLTDLDDNQPVFPRSRYTVHFKETDKIGSAVPLPMAEDADWGRNGVVSYRLASTEDEVGSSRFELREIRDNSDSSGSALSWRSLELLNRMPIDREAKSWYGLSLTAEDGGGKVGRTLLNVTINDVNDCSPEFVNASSGVKLRVDVPEDTRAHSIIFSLLAVDRDDGLNGRIVYSLRPGRRHQHATGLFGVDPYSGRVSLNSQLVYRRGEINSYDVYVTAHDSGTPRRSSEIVVEINVLDVNDHRPSIRVQGLSHSASFNGVRVKENFDYTRQEVIATLQAGDLDDGENGRVACKLASGLEKFGLHFVKGQDAGAAIVYSLYAVGAFDRESQPTLSLAVECWDHGASPMRSEVVIRIEVEDVNDSPPMWRQPEYSFSIRENQPAGSHIGRVLADDADAPPNDVIRYSIAEDGPLASRVMKVNEATGQLLTADLLDREERSSYSFKVVATNSEPPHFSATVGVTVLVLDVNDNSPKFDEATPGQVLVMEDASPMTLVALINVTDADEPGVRKFRFSVDSEDARRASKFRISDLGELLLVGGLDREVDREHRLRVTVTDNGMPQRSSSFSLTVLVGDVNDTPPTFIFPDGQREFSQVNITNSLTPNSLIASVRARDEDEGANGNVTYSLLIAEASSTAAEAAELRRYFRLDPITGYLWLRASLAHLANPTVFSLRLRATDSGRERQEKRDAMLKVLVTPAVGSGGSGGGDGGGGGGVNSGGGRGGAGPRQAVSDSHPVLLIVLLAAGLAVLLLLVLFLLAVYSVSARRRGLATSATRGCDFGGGLAAAGNTGTCQTVPKTSSQTYDSLMTKGRFDSAGHLVTPAGEFIPLAATKNRRQRTIDMFELDSGEKMLQGDREFGRQSDLTFQARPSQAYHSESDLASGAAIDCKSRHERRRFEDTDDINDENYSGPGQMYQQQQQQQHYIAGPPVCYTPLCTTRAAAAAATDSRRHYVVSSSTIAVVSPPTNKRLRAPYDNISDV